MEWDGAARLGLAVLLGGLIGFERERRGRPAGLRTMILVCLGTTLAMLVSERLSSVPDDQGTRADPTRIAAGIVTGIGFLGGGVILKLGDVIRGVTTAASIWFVAALGIAIGDRQYVLALTATILALGVLTVLRVPERLIKNEVQRRVRLVVATDAADAAWTESRRLLAEHGIRIVDFRGEEDVVRGTRSLLFRVRTDQALSGYDALRDLARLDGITQVHWE
jgi:putative Mg2+ transporter-C (MgtC) family protein